MTGKANRSPIRLLQVHYPRRFGVGNAARYVSSTRSWSQARRGPRLGAASRPYSPTVVTEGSERRSALRGRAFSSAPRGFVAAKPFTARGVAAVIDRGRILGPYCAQVVARPPGAVERTQQEVKWRVLAITDGRLRRASELAPTVGRRRNWPANASGKRRPRSSVLPERTHFLPVRAQCG